MTYAILIESGLLRYPSTWLPRSLPPLRGEVPRRSGSGEDIFSTIVIITDHTVKKLYGNDLADCLIKQGHEVLLLSFRPGEQSKNSLTKQKLEKKMFKNHCDRNTLCLALGGGVVGDLAGFIAATYMRGISYIQIPTTLLAMVDSSIGGKTGIDTDYGKNLIGAFWQPQAVVADLNCLKTLPYKHLINGLVEILKVFLIYDKNSFLYFKRNIKKIKISDELVLNNLIFRAVKIKTKIVKQDEQDHHLRKILNFGHTIGHALEKISGYKILHGEAVGLGMLVESRISNVLGILGDEDNKIIENILFELGISNKKLKKINVDKVIQATKLDKKIKQGQVHYVLLKEIGQVYKCDREVTHSVPDKTVKELFSSLWSSFRGVPRSSWGGTTSFRGIPRSSQDDLGTPRDDDQI